jgi:hypothetical protein
MKALLVLTIAVLIASPAAGFNGVGGMRSTANSAVTGGAFGASPTAPGTNSLGTALSSGGAGRRMKGPPLGTGNPAIDRDDKRVARIVHSICRGC